jgi:hypothetical protein
LAPTSTTGALLVAGLVATRALAQASDDAQERAIAAIEKRGGMVGRDEKSPGKPATLVSLSGTKITDDELALLEPLTKLQTLILTSTPITDAGLVHLEGLN